MDWAVTAQPQSLVRFQVDELLALDVKWNSGWSNEVEVLLLVNLDDRGAVKYYVKSAALSSVACYRPNESKVGPRLNCPIPEYYHYR